jgi:HSP20 family protein
MTRKRSFFERLTGSVSFDEAEEVVVPPTPEAKSETNWLADEEEGELAVDVYQTSSEIVIKAMLSGVRPEDLNISINRETVTIKGKREPGREVNPEDYFQKELYWGAFSRTILLPAEIEVEEAEALEKHGLLTIRLPKIDKHKIQNLKVKSV